jgi:hypothetical protein
MMDSFRPDRKTIVTLVLVTLITFTLSSVLGYSLDVFLGNVYTGTPIAETPFANISSTEPDDRMIPGSAVRATADGVTMNVVYDESELVNITQAIDAAKLFLAQFDYIPPMNFTPVEPWSQLQGTSWTLKFNSTVMDVYVAVNAVTRSVTAFAINWYDWLNPSPYVRTLNGSIMDIPEIEQAALRFFEQNGITLSAHSYYVTASLEYSTRFLTHNVYALRFFEVINNTLVHQNVVSVYLDVLTGEVVHFTYVWVFVNDIPTSGIIDQGLAGRLALAYVTDKHGIGYYRVTRTILEFIRFGSYLLCWVVYTDDPYYGGFYVNAKTGEIVDVMGGGSGSLSSFIDNSDIDLVAVALPFVVSVPLAIAACLTVGRLMKKGQQNG